MRIEDLRDTSVLVVGAGLSGASVVRFLARHDIAFDLVDDGGVSPALAGAVVRGGVHAHLDAALARRFDVIVLSPGVPRAHPAIDAALVSGARVIGDIELFAHRVRAPLVAVTGSNGKSTVVAWLAEVLTRAGIRALACGNIGRPALDSLDDAVECYVLELSSYQLESTVSLVPHVATVLNVSEDHLDRYDSLLDYAAVKRRVHARAAHLVVNADDPASAPDDSHVPDGPSLTRFTLREIDTDASGVAVDGGATLWHRTRRGGCLWLCRDGEALFEQATLSVPGDHNAANALAVLALHESLGERFAALADSRTATLAAVCAFRGLPHRTRLVGEAHGVRWYDDSKGTNVDACAKALAAMPGPVVLIAGGLAKEADFTPLRPLLERHARAVVLIGRDRERLHAAFEGVAPLHRADSLEEAVRLCRELARPGDAVLLSPACASFDMFADFEERGRRFGACVEEVLAA